MVVLNFEPETAELRLYAGDDAVLDIHVTTDGVPVDVTGWTGRCEFRANVSSPDVAAEFTVEVVDALEGHLRMVFDGDTTSALAPKYPWAGTYDVQLNDAGGMRRTAFKGPVSIGKDVTA